MSEDAHVNGEQVVPMPRLVLRSLAGAVCGRCQWFRSTEEGKGNCWANPPTAALLLQNGKPVPASFRPVVDVTEEACRLFKRS